MGKTCNRCGRKIKARDTLAYQNGYGPVCWEKEGKFLVNIPQNEEIETLREEVKALKELVANLQVAPQIPMPSETTPNGKKEHKPTMLRYQQQRTIALFNPADLFDELNSVFKKKGIIIKELA